MANPEHLKILKQGVEAWNRWRENNIELEPDLCETSLIKLDLAGANFSGANLNGTILCWANLNHANISGATLIRADLCLGTLVEADLSGSNLKLTCLDNANLTRANLSDVDLSWANLSWTNLMRAGLDNANLTKAKLEATIFGYNDLSSVKGLESVRHSGASSIGIDTIYRSKGNIPEIFLRGCGVPENFITYMHSLTGQALEFYKCFISFTEADDAFSGRLYNDLQGAGVRCWRWKEDAKWGKALMRSIDEAVRYYDKLIVICSEQSLNSPAVIREIERALQKEDEGARQGQDSEVLFPIRLDDYIFTGWDHYRKADVVAKNVGDFRHWNEPEQYKKAFNRLLRDLKASE